MTLVKCLYESDDLWHSIIVIKISLGDGLILGTIFQHFSWREYFVNMHFGLNRATTAHPYAPISCCNKSISHKVSPEPSVCCAFYNYHIGPVILRSGIALFYLSGISSFIRIIECILCRWVLKNI